MAANKCPGCSGNGVLLPNKHSVYVCQSCGGIFGDMYYGEAFEYVQLNRWSKDVNAEGKYFDFTLLSGSGIKRVHGWFNPADKCIVQTG